MFSPTPSTTSDRSASPSTTKSESLGPQSPPANLVDSEETSCGLFDSLCCCITPGIKDQGEEEERQLLGNAAHKSYQAQAEVESDPDIEWWKENLGKEIADKGRWYDPANDGLPVTETYGYFAISVKPGEVRIWQNPSGGMDRSHSSTTLLGMVQKDYRSLRRVHYKYEETLPKKKQDLGYELYKEAYSKRKFIFRNQTVDSITREWVFTGQNDEFGKDSEVSFEDFLKYAKKRLIEWYHVREQHVWIYINMFVFALATLPSEDTCVEVIMGF